jgi:hypothetical protein
VPPNQTFPFGRICITVSKASEEEFFNDPVAYSAMLTETRFEEVGKVGQRDGNDSQGHAGTVIPVPCSDPERLGGIGIDNVRDEHPIYGFA